MILYIDKAHKLKISLETKLTEGLNDIKQSLLVTCCVSNMWEVEVASRIQIQGGYDKGRESKNVFVWKCDYGCF